MNNLLDKKALPLVAALLISFYGHAQRFTISGSVKDQNSGENLIGASIYNVATQQGTTANTYGFYSLTLPGDSVRLQISFVGYESKNLKFLLNRDTTIHVVLASGTMLGEVVVTGSKEDRIQESSRMSTIDVPVEQIKAMPALMGEVDVFKVLQLLPGVQSGAEGSSGLYIRGGGPDQNLILLDGVPVYNASHLFGFLSVFNADAINHVELIKGGFPARYGGRLSSVIEISMKEGNAKEVKGEGSIGLVAARFTIEGPIKEKTSFIVSARRTYLDAFARPMIKMQTNGELTTGYYFYDLNTKINHKINDQNKIYLSAYFGDDHAYARSRTSVTYVDTVNIKEHDDSGLRWGNITTALRWNKILSNKIFSNLTATYSRYRFNVFSESDETVTSPYDTTRFFRKNDYNSGIRDFALKLDFDFIPNPNHYLKFGVHAINHLFTPGVLSYNATEKRDTTFGARKIFAQEFSLYVEDDFMVTPELKINGGIHASGFSVAGKFYHAIQPRLSARYLLSPSLSLKASYARMAQYIHLLTNAGLGLPTDLWVPATDRVKPERAYIYAIGGAYNLRNNYEFSLEGYYKKMYDLIEYKDGASYIDIESEWDTKVVSGEGESYGAEFFLQKKTGKISGWVGYTLSWTNRTFPNVNEGKSFPYRYDRRHDVELALAYKWKKNKEVSLTWVYGTGAAITLPESSYSQQTEYPDPYDGRIKHYKGRNAYRMRPYHRLDLGYTTTKQTKWGERSWSFSLYNLYNRKNPFFIDTAHDKNGRQKFVQYSLFPIIPSIAFRFKF